MVAVVILANPLEAWADECEVLLADHLALLAPHLR